MWGIIRRVSPSVTRVYRPPQLQRRWTFPMSTVSSPELDSLSLIDTVSEDNFSQCVSLGSIVDRPDGGAGLAGQSVKIGGRVHTGREQGKGAFAFLEVYDSSCKAKNLQVVVDKSVYKLSDLVPRGTSVHVEGELKLPPEGSKEKVELRVKKVLRVGTVDAAKYPLPKGKISLEDLRDNQHFRARTKIINSITRMDNGLGIGTHAFYQKHDFLWIHTPIITTSDCEGAGEMFQVTTLFSEAEKLVKEVKQNPIDPLALEADIRTAELDVKEKGKAVAELKSAKAGKEEITGAVVMLTKAIDSLAKLHEKLRLEERCRVRAGLPLKDGKIDYSKDFFARQAFLTVSGQLQLEAYACAPGRVYTFGPTFRAEQSHTSRHLAEFRMVESEIAFADIENVMNCAEAYVKYMCKWLLDHCLDDMELMVKHVDATAIDRLRMVASTEFIRLTYTDAIEHLVKASEVKKFENKVEWGIDLASEHEKYLTDEVFKKPVIVYNYPKDIKPFYMKVNEDQKTVAAMDVLVPKIGELVGGGQREEDYEALKARMLEMGVLLEPYEWYLDLRRYGTVMHSGFGLGFERMVQFATGIDNIKDVASFPRSPGRADL